MMCVELNTVVKKTKATTTTVCVEMVLSILCRLVIDMCAG